jgi:ribosomal protein S27AE
VALLEETGEYPVRKQCPLCGAGPVLLAWRPIPDGAGEAVESSPLDLASWWPMDPVRDARLTCPRCKNLAYGRVVALAVNESGLLDGHFIPVTAAELVAW